MIISRKLDDLHPAVRSRAVHHIALCDQHGIELLPICTYRDIEAQQALWEKGRKLQANGQWIIVDTHAIVTRAKPGESLHQFHLAYDGVPIVHGKPLWSVFNSAGNMLEIWRTVADCADAAGLEWAGNWPHFKEYDHFQYTGGLSLAQIQAGVIPTA